MLQVSARSPVLSLRSLPGTTVVPDTGQVKTTQTIQSPAYATRPWNHSSNNTSAREAEAEVDL